MTCQTKKDISVIFASQRIIDNFLIVTFFKQDILNDVCDQKMQPPDGAAFEMRKLGWIQISILHLPFLPYIQKKNSNVLFANVSEQRRYTVESISAHFFSSLGSGSIFSHTDFSRLHQRDISHEPNQPATSWITLRTLFWSKKLFEN